MPNIKLTIEYDGARYAGWQRQNSRQSTVHRPQIKTIQEEIEKALQKIFQKKIPVIGSGRTDSGVHAAAQSANFRLDKAFDLRKLQKALNSLLPRDIVLRAIEKVPLRFHARFSALSKHYRYIIVNRDMKSAFVHGLACLVRRPLDISLMRREARCLLGRHDFKSFHASDRRERSTTTTVTRLDIRKIKAQGIFPFLKGLELVVVDIEASGFLRNMVRNIVGTLIDIGLRKVKQGELERILKKRDRRRAGHCAPPQGLYLCDVRYD